ncbi:MAG TPA: PilZ domain-containing protein [Phycisphaerae bacterium]|nr:PilZ domain-containing protein [Phycisphaerae bacterium]
MKFDVERRTHRRYDLSGPFDLLGGNGAPAHARLLNLSDGGAFVSLPIGSLPSCGKRFDVRFIVPRATANTRMVEEFSCRATVVRHQPLFDDNFGGVGLQFAQPLQLAIEV